MPRDKPRTTSLHPRESFVCIFLFLVELAAVWSMVALIYLTFTVYLPTTGEQEEGLHTDPVMCQTTKFEISNECSWWSCMEWCLSSTQPPDECIHIYTSVRNYGSQVVLEGCQNSYVKHCPFMDMDDPLSDAIQSCKEDFGCNNLHGFYKCEDPYQPNVDDYQKQRGGACKNITHMYTCTVELYGEKEFNCVQRKANCLDLEGMFECEAGVCRRMIDYHCERRCHDITCHKSVIIQSGDNIFLGDCDSVYNNDTQQIIWENDEKNALLANCLSVELDPNDPENMTYIAEDCVNGTLLPRNFLPKTVNYTKLQELFKSELSYENRLDKDNLVDIPFDIDILIYNETKLKMNHEGCSNTLSAECTMFHRDYGKDGRNYTSPSRFPCYYTQKHGDFVTAHLNLQQSHQVYLFLLIVPLSVFIFSCFCCGLCSALIIVDEEGHMHLKGCYDWFKRPRTEYEKWLDQHEEKRSKREKKELKRQEKEDKRIEKLKKEAEDKNMKKSRNDEDKNNHEERNRLEMIWKKGVREDQAKILGGNSLDIEASGMEQQMPSSLSGGNTGQNGHNNRSTGNIHSGGIDRAGNQNLPLPRSSGNLAASHSGNRLSQGGNMVASHSGGRLSQGGNMVASHSGGRLSQGNTVRSPTDGNIPYSNGNRVSGNITGNISFTDESQDGNVLLESTIGGRLKAEKRREEERMRLERARQDWKDRRLDIDWNSMDWRQEKLQINKTPRSDCSESACDLDDVSIHIK